MKPSVTEILGMIEALGWEIVLPPIKRGNDSIPGFICGKPEYVKTVIDESRMSGGFGPVDAET